MVLPTLPRVLGEDERVKGVDLSRVCGREHIGAVALQSALHALVIVFEVVPRSDREKERRQRLLGRLSLEEAQRVHEVVLERRAVLPDGIALFELEVAILK